MHVGIIMDGNRRWATARNLAKSLWHNAGVRALEKTLEHAITQDIDIISFWALAKKNIEERTETELHHLFELLKKEVRELIPKMVKNGVKFETIGNLSLLPKDVTDVLESAKSATSHLNAIICILAIGHGGQDEIIRGVKAAIQAWVDPETLDEKSFLNHLDSGRFPAPDLIIRTGGDLRHSGYFLYQSEYSEYYFTETLWPDFDETEFKKALASYSKAQRNFGK